MRMTSFMQKKERKKIGATLLLIHDQRPFLCQQHVLPLRVLRFSSTTERSACSSEFSSAVGLGFEYGDAL